MSGHGRAGAETSPGADPSGGVQDAIRSLVRSATGASVTAIEGLTGGLGTRRFFRVGTDGVPATLVARVEAPEDTDSRPAGAAPEPPLEPLRARLEACGLPVPRSFGADPEHGILLLEDAGPVSLERALAEADPGERVRLIAAAVDLIPRLQRVDAPPAGGVAAFERRMDAELIRFKAGLFCEWSLPQALGRPPSAAERGVVMDAFALIGEAVESAPRRLAHRDLQSRNVHRHPETGDLLLIDLQGALLAPPEYDLVCLLRDSYVELPEDEVAAHLAEVRPRLPDAPDPASFEQRFDLLTLSRKGKDHARFLQAQARGDRSYLAYLPATVRHLRRAAGRTAALDPALARHAELIAKLPERP